MKGQLHKGFGKQDTCEGEATCTKYRGRGVGDLYVPSYKASSYPSVHLRGYNLPTDLKAC